VTARWSEFEQAAVVAAVKTALGAAV
jgi:hypothetical protein